MPKIIAFTALLLFALTTHSSELIDSKIYKLKANIDVKELGDVGSPAVPASSGRPAKEATAPKIYTAVMNSKFQVLSKNNDGNYLVVFSNIVVKKSVTNPVEHGTVYILPAKIEDSLEISKMTQESFTGLSSGPLVVPFKYRTGDDSISGDAALGLYAGVTWEPGCIGDARWCFRVTPIISAGLSQVSVANGGQTDSKTAATWATGLLITDWADINIGVVYGQDRIGDKSWEHEGDGWYSLMVGWDI